MKQYETRFSVIVFFLFLGFLFYLPSPEFDFWWHLKTGEIIWQLKHVPHADIFSFGKTVRWVHHEWLSDVLFYLAYAAGSFYGILILRAAVLCAACYFVFKMCVEETRDTAVSIVATLCCAYVLAPWKPGAGLRPQFFTYFFIALTHYLLFYRKKTAWLPFVFFLWANLHGGYLSGFILLFAFCISEWLSKDRRRFFSGLKLSALCFLAGLLTPNHVYELIYPFQILMRRDLYQYNYEWFPPDIHKLYALPFYGLVFAFLISCALRSRRFREGEIFFVFPYLLLSLLSLRNMPLFALAVSPYLARRLQSAPETKIFTRKSGMILLAILLMVTFRDYYMEYVPLHRRTLSPSVMAEQVPVKAVEFIKGNKLPGPLFPEPDWGGYVIFKLYPAYKVGADTRFDTVYDKDYLVRVIEAFSGQSGWEKIFAETKTNLILLDAIATPLKEELYASDDYKLIYYDRQSVLFMRDAPGNKQSIEKFFTGDVKARQLAYYDYRHGMEELNENRLEEAQKFFLDGIPYAPRDEKLHYFLGVTFSRQKKYDAAYWSLKAAAALSPENAEVLYSFSYACVMLGKKQEAKGTLEKLLAVFPSHEDAKKLLKGIEIMEKEKQKSP